MPNKKAAQFHGFDGGLGQALIVHAAEQPIALLGIGNDAARKRGRFALAAAAAKLPDGIYELCNDDALQGNSWNWLVGSSINIVLIDTKRSSDLHGNW